MCAVIGATDIKKFSDQKLLRKEPFYGLVFLQLPPLRDRHNDGWLQNTGPGLSFHPSVTKLPA
jgi:hypothetical protein